MSKKYNLLHEDTNSVEVLSENTDTGKRLYIEGIMAQANIRNGNGRMYERPVMEAAVQEYVDKYVSTRQALGELNHPERPFVDPSEAAIRITELRMDGDNVYGKALVLNTPKGQIIKGLLEGGFALGVSTRGLGTLKERNGIKYVQNDFMMTAIDAVSGPSAPEAYVSALTESRKWMITESGVWQPVDGIEQPEFNEELFLEKLEQYIKGLKN